MIIVGLTGGIATGKSTVAGMFARLGAYRIDTDQLARAVVESGQPGLSALVAYFGIDILEENGTLNRAKLGAIVFADQKKRQVLESILHPLISERLQAELLSAADRGEDVVLLEVPLLFETNFAHRQRIDHIIVVTAEEAVQLTRLLKRDRLTEEAARLRISAQLPLKEKIARADFVIDNSQTPENTEQQVLQIWQQLRQENPT